VDGFRLDTVNYYFHDKQLRNNPPMIYDTDGAGMETDTNPYSMQNHLYDKTQPENIGFLKRLRALLDSYDNRATVGEVGDGPRSLSTLALYTTGNDKLHMCYTFDLLGPAFEASYIRKVMTTVADTVSNGWVCWAFSNHDVVRHVTRFTEDAQERDRVAKLSITLLSMLRGSICLYQGEELGLTEAELAYEDLRDPYGIRFWPAFKGRDGCRTPMVWEASVPHAGFTEGPKTWLPVPSEHAARAVDIQEKLADSVLNHYRAALTFRKAHPPLVDGDMTFLDTNQDLLAFVREKGGEKLFFVFNLTREAQDFTLPKRLGDCLPVSLPGFSSRLVKGVVKLDALDVFCARV
jgi:alpha-glucosidase